MSAPARSSEAVLRELEQETATAVSRAVDQAVAGRRPVREALAAAMRQVTQIIGRAVAQATRLASTAAGVGRRARRVERRTRRGRRRRSEQRAASGVDVAGPVRLEFERTAAALQKVNEPGRVRQGFARLKDRLAGVVTDLVGRAASAGTDAVARRTGATGIMWVAERDSCLVCLSLSGHIMPPGRRFPESVTFGDTPLRWPKFTGLPPRHPRCRCRPRAVFGDASAESAALQREARRSVVRGFSMPSESQAARLRAADRLLRRGAGLPRSVEEYGRRAVREGRFPAGRQIPAGAGRRRR